MAVFTMAMFLNTNTTAGSSDLDLASLVNLNSANAECRPAGHITFFSCNAFDRCAYSGSTENNCRG